MNPTESSTCDANPEERAARDESLELRSRLERLAAAVPGVLYSFRLRPDGTICMPYASPTIESLFGLRPQDLVVDASPIWALVHPDDLPTLLTGIADSARELSSWNAEFRVTPPGREEIWVGGCSEPTREPDGGTLWHGFLSDTTERKRSELRLRESERRLADTQRIARLGSWELDHGTGAAAWSEELARIFELEEPLDGDPYDSFLTRVHPEDRDRVERELRASIQNRATFETTSRLLLSQGRIRWIHSTAETRYDGEGRALLTIGGAQDVTWQRFAEAQLRKLSVVLARTPLSVVITDLDGNIEYVNPAFTQVSGDSAEEVLGRNPRILGSGETPRETFAKLWRTIRAGGVWNGELRNRRKSGEPFREEAWISPVVDDDGRTTSYVAIKQDVTEHLLPAQARLTRDRGPPLAAAGRQRARNPSPSPPAAAPRLRAGRRVDGQERRPSLGARGRAEVSKLPLGPRKVFPVSRGPAPRIARSSLANIVYIGVVPFESSPFEALDVAWVSLALHRTSQEAPWAIAPRRENEEIECRPIAPPGAPRPRAPAPPQSTPRSCSAPSRPSATATSPCACRATGTGSPASSPTPSTRSSPPTIAPPPS